MSNQLLPEINREETKLAVENALERYRIYMLTQPEDLQPKTTQQFSFIPLSNTNAFHSSTEQAAVQNVDREIERRNYIKKIQNAINRLGYLERAILILRYMDREEKYDYEVYNQLGMSERKYYRVKGTLFYNFAFALRIEVYKEEDVNRV